MWRILCLTAIWLVSVPVQVMASPENSEHGISGQNSTATPVQAAQAGQIAQAGQASGVCEHTAELVTALKAELSPAPAPDTSGVNNNNNTAGSGLSVKAAQANGPQTKGPQTALPTDKVIAQKTATMRIDVHYPELGIAPIDTDIGQWALQLVENFQTEFEGETAEIRTPYDLSSTYTLLRPATDTAVTVVWEIASYTQGAHGNRDIVTSSYSLPDGQPIGLGELFVDLGTALNLMSEAAYTRLSRSLGDMLNDDMVRGGTTPDPDNFSSFALVPGAIRIFFQPYQVAPWAAGPQQVDIPLEELEDAGPQYQFWGGKKEEVEPPL